MEKELICFDMDNTLIHSNKSHLLAFKLCFEKFNLPKKTDKEILSWFGLTGEVLVRKLYPSLNHKKLKKVVDCHDALVVSKTHRYAKAIPGAINVLKRLKTHYKIAVLSNCKHKEIIPMLRGAGINHKLFDLVIGNDDVKHGKPSPDEIFKAEKLLHVNSACMVGDSIYDIKAGKKAKVKTIAVLTGIHTKSMLKKEHPDLILKSVKEIKKVFIPSKVIH